MPDVATLSAYGEQTEPKTLRIQRLLPGAIERVWAYGSGPTGLGLTDGKRPTNTRNVVAYAANRRLTRRGLETAAASFGASARTLRRVARISLIRFSFSIFRPNRSFT